MTYPKIIIPGAPITKKNRQSAHCTPTGLPPREESKKDCQGTSRPGISDGIDKAEKDYIISFMLRSWGLPTIRTAVNCDIKFFVAKFPGFPGLAGRDLSNCYQLYEDLLQADQWRNVNRGRYRGTKKLVSAGAGIIHNDSLIQGHNGSGFVFYCSQCGGIHSQYSIAN